MLSCKQNMTVEMLKPQPPRVDICRDCWSRNFFPSGVIFPENNIKFDVFHATFVLFVRGVVKKAMFLRLTALGPPPYGKLFVIFLCVGFTLDFE